MKIVLLADNGDVLTQWAFDSQENSIGRLTFKNPSHVGTFLTQAQAAMDKEKESFVLTEERPYPCGYCSKACSGPYCNESCQVDLSTYLLDR